VSASTDLAALLSEETRRRVASAVREGEAVDLIPVHDEAATRLAEVLEREESESTARGQEWLLVAEMVDARLDPSAVIERWLAPWHCPGKIDDQARSYRAGMRSCRTQGLVGLLAGWGLLACGSGPPEVRPGWFDSPSSTAVHGPFVEKTYRRSNGPQSIHYKVIEVGGSPVQIAGGYIERTTYCGEAGVDAVGFTVRGEPGTNGIYVLHVDGRRQILERLCDYQPTPGRWKGMVLTGCATQWDAKAQQKRPAAR